PVEKAIERIAQELTFDISSFDLKNRPKGFDEPRWLLANGFFRSGERNPSMLCLAATCKNLHHTESQTRGMLQGAAVDQAARTGEQPFDDHEIDAIIGQVYGPNWKGGMFTTRDPNNWLAQYSRKMGLHIKEEADDTPKTLHSVAPAFVNFVMNIEKNTIKTGIPSLDKAMPITIGSNIGVVAAAGAGKTALALKILKYNSKNGIVTVFASLDMHRVRLFEKVAYNVTGLSRDDLYAAIRAGDYKAIVDKIQAEYGNVWFYDKSAASVKDIAQYVREVETITGEKVKLVMIDYFERVNSDVADDTAASKKVANEIQDMIVDLDVAVITLCQPNKMSLGSGPDTEIVSYTAIKGSSFLYQSFRGIIGMSRPFYTPRTKELDNYIIFNLLKNDLGELDRLEFGWKGKTGEIYELEDCERKELKDLMSMKNGDKDNKGDGGWD
ncbi:MAG TPA: DnaB-like helicase C-terminal domain-containing protein, partial [Flavobacterium sp.]